MKRSPYTFPARSRKAMLAYLADHDGYYPMNSWNGGFVLAWCIKVHNADYSGKFARADYPVQDRFDDQWREYCDADSELFWEACRNATREYTDGDWTNYPGIEQGEWKFEINGRSGGYMVLDAAPSWLPAPRAWRMSNMIWSDRASYVEWLGELSTATLKRFYRAVRVLDRDLRPEACCNEISYQFAFQRHMWEESLIAAEDCDAKKQEKARPDLYAE